MRQSIFLTAFCAMTCLMLSSQVFATEWELVSESSDTSSRFYVEKNSIRYVDRSWMFWEKTVLDTPETNTAGKRYRAVKVLFKADCAKKARAVVQAVYLFSDDGAPVDSFSVPAKEQEWVYLVPGSVAEGTLEFVCKEIIKKQALKKPREKPRVQNQEVIRVIM